MTIPFESYAKLIRNVAPLVRKVLFYDGEIRPTWISDGMEEPELRSAVVLLMADRSRFEDGLAVLPIGAEDTQETFFLFAVRRQDDIGNANARLAGNHIGGARRGLRHVIERGRAIRPAPLAHIVGLGAKGHGIHQ